MFTDNRVGTSSMWITHDEPETRITCGRIVAAILTLCNSAILHLVAVIFDVLCPDIQEGQYCAFIMYIQS